MKDRIEDWREIVMIIEGIYRAREHMLCVLPKSADLSEALAQNSCMMA